MADGRPGAEGLVCLQILVQLMSAMLYHNCVQVQEIVNNVHFKVDKYLRSKVEKLCDETKKSADKLNIEVQLAFRRPGSEHAASYASHDVKGVFKTLAIVFTYLST